MSATLALARADVLERVRRSGFLVLTGLVLWLAFGAYQGNVHVRLGLFTGAWDSAWAGGMMAMIAGTYLSLFGFWFVKNAVERDERTGVGEILATTPLARVSYVLGKALSHFTVLALMAGVLFGSAIVIQLAKGGGAVRLLDYAAPFAFVALPALAVTAACAILFETTPGLSGAFGNAAWMFLWTALFVGGMQARTPLQDLVGLRALEGSMSAAIDAQFPGQHDHELSISLGPEHFAGMKTFRWPGMTWTLPYLLARLSWLAIALGIALLAAAPFHRFDPARGRLRAPPTAAKQRRWRIPRLPALPGLVGAEFRLGANSAGPWWLLVALPAWVASWFVPLPFARSVLLVGLLVWGLPRWSPLGAREVQAGAETFVRAAPGAAWRQPLAAWAAGALMFLLLALPVCARLALGGEAFALAALVSGAAFVPALALALGAWSGTPRAFEALYALLWYAGPLNRIGFLDYAGTTLGAPIVQNAAATATGAPHPALWFALAAALLGLAIAARVRDLFA